MLVKLHVSPVQLGVKEAVGGVLGGNAVTLCDVELVAPPLSVTVRLTLYVPPAAYACTTFWLVDVVPSPKLQLQATTLPSGSVLVLVKVQLSPVQFDVNAAVGGRFPGGPWHGVLPASENVCPSSAKNFHSYPVGRSTRRKTPCALFCTTSLFG